MSWDRYLADAAMLHAIFSSEVPKPNQVDLHEILLHRDGPRVYLDLTCLNFLSRPQKVGEGRI